MNLEELEQIAVSEREAQEKATHHVKVCVAAGCLSCQSQGVKDSLAVEATKRGLGESVHVKGKWRHRHVASIGSFVAETLDVEARRDFWKAANERLSIYVNDDERSEIEAALARRVPPTTAAEEAEWQRQADESLQWLKERSGRASLK